MQHFTEASATMLSHRHNSDFTLFDSQVMLLALASCLCIGSYLRTWGTGVCSVSMWRTIYSLRWPQDSLLTDLKRIPEDSLPTKPQCPQNSLSEKAQLSVFSRFRLVSFKCNSANMNGVALCVGTLLGLVFISSTYSEMATKAEFTGVGRIYVTELQSNEKAHLCKWYSVFCHWVTKQQIDG